MAIVASPDNLNEIAVLPIYIYPMIKTSFDNYHLLSPIVIV